MSAMELINREISSSTGAGLKLSGAVFNGRGMAGAAAGALLIAFLIAKAIELNVRVWRKFPGHPVLVMMIAWFLASMLILGAVFSFQSWPWWAMCITSFLFWTLASKIIEVYYDPVFQRDVNPEVIIDDVLHRPWFATG